ARIEIFAGSTTLLCHCPLFAQSPPSERFVRQGLYRAAPACSACERQPGPSCLISYSHWLPDGSLSDLVGRHGAMNPAGRVRCNMPTKLAIVPVKFKYCFGGKSPRTFFVTELS